MHESSYSPPLPLNLCRVQSAELFEGSEWLVTGFNWSRSPLLVTAFFSWLLFVQMALSSSVALLSSVFIMSVPIQCWFASFQLLETFIHNSCMFFLLFLLNHLIDNSFSILFSCIISTLFSIWGTKQFKDAFDEQTYVDFPPSQPVWYF